jgi:Zn-dependent protease
MEQNPLFAISLLISAWFVFYFAAVLLKTEKYGLEVHPFYALYKSTRLNTFLYRIGSWNPTVWRVFGNIGVASFFGQVGFLSYLLFQNLYRFIYVPQKASPVMPLIPGVTITLSSLPWFLAAAGVVILFHELGHGVLCVAEGVPVKSSAILLAVLTFGGAVESDEEAMEKAGMMSKMRIFAAGSFINLIMGLLITAIFFLTRIQLLPSIGVFLQWIYFLAINLALANMLPIYPLDGGQMLKTYLAARPGNRKVLEKVTMYGFFALMVSNIVLSLIRFGLIPL